ncbi:hypothetical protein K435DRAFT_775767 [Dendrothele bispora CBS 962.96]|uniref:Uncharacterized protein n=1 Tax=Dendrothele bispora (strain CBS 962.96) TaxID=1314807 RepID=A0A4S8MH77_DENBC|nr:hypothetical protein K435DRAFT_775767 [Dendrothele bispora CBS 962.96]
MPTLNELVIEEMQDYGNQTVTQNLLQSLQVSVSSDIYIRSFSTRGALVPRLKDLTFKLKNLPKFDLNFFEMMVRSRWIPGSVRSQEVGVTCLHSFRLEVKGGEVEDTLMARSLINLRQSRGDRLRDEFSFVGSPAGTGHSSNQDGTNRDKSWSPFAKYL